MIAVDDDDDVMSMLIVVSPRSAVDVDERSRFTVDRGRDGVDGIDDDGDDIGVANGDATGVRDDVDADVAESIALRRCCCIASRPTRRDSMRIGVDGAMIVGTSDDDDAIA